MEIKSLLGAIGVSRILVLVGMCFMPAGNVLADFTAILDLQRVGDIIEGHAETMISPSSTPQILFNDVNELPLAGNDLLLDHLLFTPTFPSTLQFDVTICVNQAGSCADPAELIFVNTSLPGDSVFFGFENLDLGGAYVFDSATFEVGILGTFSAVSESGFDVTGNGSAGSLMELFFFFNDPTVFDGVDTFTMDARFSAVPVPASVWLFGSGLLGVIGVARRKV